VLGVLKDFPFIDGLATLLVQHALADLSDDKRGRRQALNEPQLERALFAAFNVRNQPRGELLSMLGVAKRAGGRAKETMDGKRASMPDPFLAFKNDPLTKSLETAAGILRSPWDPQAVTLCVVCDGTPLNTKFHAGKIDGEYVVLGGTFPSHAKIPAGEELDVEHLATEMFAAVVKRADSDELVGLSSIPLPSDGCNGVFVLEFVHNTLQAFTYSGVPKVVI